MANTGIIGKIFSSASKAVTGKDEELNAGLKFIKNHVIKPVAKGKEEGIYQHILPYKLNSKLAWGGVAAVGAGTLGVSGLQSRNLASMGGRVTGERLSGMTDTVKLSRGIERMQKGKHVQFDNSLRNGGADGEIVFALHNMR